VSYTVNVCAFSRQYSIIFSRTPKYPG